jgi:hypothetical protein
MTRRKEAEEAAARESEEKYPHGCSDRWTKDLMIAEVMFKRSRRSDSTISSSKPIEAFYKTHRSARARMVGKTIT